MPAPTAEIVPPSAPPRLQRIAAVINPASGSVGPGAEATVAEMVAAHGYRLEVFTPGDHGVEAAVRAAVASDPDLVLVLAGDGTARLAAGLCGPKGPLVAPLPGGTLNMLPHAIYGQGAWREVLARTLAEGAPRWVCGGQVGGRWFYVAAILGSAALLGHAREAVRAGNLRQAVRRARFALRRAFTGRIHYALDGGPAQAAEALALISPTVSRTMDENSALEAAGLDPHNAREVFRLAFNGLVGDWRDDPGVTAQACARGRVSAHHTIPAILDGEIERLPRRVTFAFEPRAFRALVAL